MDLTLLTIDRETEKLAQDWNALVEAVNALDAALEALKTQAAPTIRRIAGEVQKHRGQVAGMVQAAPHLFEKPRTIILHGFKVGFRKGPGGITWEDDDRVVDLISEKLPDQFEGLVEIIRKPVKAALEKLPVADLKRIGCTVVASGDQVVVKAAAGDAEKIVAAYLAEKTE